MARLVDTASHRNADGPGTQRRNLTSFPVYSLPPSDLGMNFFLTKHRPGRETPIFLVNTDRDVVARYQNLMTWDVRDEFVSQQEPINRFADVYTTGSAAG